MTLSLSLFFLYGKQGEAQVRGLCLVCELLRFADWVSAACGAELPIMPLGILFLFALLQSIPPWRPSLNLGSWANQCVACYPIILDQVSIVPF